MSRLIKALPLVCCSIITLGSSLAGNAAEVPDPRIERLTLQLIDARSGRLTIPLSDQERRDLIRDTGRAAFSIAMTTNDPPIFFNDLGQEADLRADDGLFSGVVPVDLNALQAVNAEAAQLRTRTIQRFIPGTRDSAGTEVLPAIAIDLERLRAGAVIQLPSITEFGPLKVLGAGSSALINPQKSLLITSLPVIEDGTRAANPCGSIAANSPLKSWSFGHLMEEMSQGSGLTPAAFTENWLQHWRTQQTVLDATNTIVLDGINNPSLANIDARIINPWRARSGGGPLNLAIAPFRLQAIVYRPDLGKVAYGVNTGNTPGELRFVFGAMEVRDSDQSGDALGAGDTCQTMEVAVIFEYGIPINNCVGIKNWANEWVALSGLLPGTPAFNGKLETLTESVVVHGAAPTKPNQNALNQLRTNEIDLTGIWQMREFRLATGSGPLRQSTTVNNPREHQAAFTSIPAVTPLPINLDGSALLLNEIQTNLPDILANKYKVPEFSLGFAFQGGASSYNFNTSWDHPVLSTPAELEGRFKFSLNTCSGCHTGETDTSFYHIRPQGIGFPPVLSQFLLNDPHNVVDVRGIPRVFHEMTQRKQALSKLANKVCSPKLGLPFFIEQKPLLSVH